MNLRLTRLLFVIALLTVSFSSWAKVTLETYKDNVEVTLKIEDEITRADLDDFRKALAQIDEYHSVLHMNAVHLNSLGGNAVTAREIGRILRERKLNTYLGPKDSCASACVDVLIAGVMRFAFGEVQVHRGSFSGDPSSTDKIAEVMEGWAKELREYVQSMGVSMLLTDAIETTPNWQLRTLTPSEIRQWQVLGTDKVTEETLFTELSREKFISRKEFIGIYRDHYDECLLKAKEFEMTVFDCVKPYRATQISFWEICFERIVEWINKNIVNRHWVDHSTHHQQVEANLKLVHEDQMYKRHMAISVQSEATDQTSQNTIKQFPDEVAQKLEESNVWWVSDNKLYIVLKNPSDKDIKRLTFSLTENECAKKGNKRFMTLELLEPLDRYRKVLYSGPLPFDYDKEIGKGERCGVIEEALQLIQR